MRQFLRETWQIWYWAYFQPSRLQAWVDRVGKQSDGWLSRLDSVFGKPAFATRFALLVLLLLIPLIAMVAWQGQPLDWLIVLTALLCLYGLSIFPLAVSLTTPWLFLLVYSINPAPLRQAIVVAGEILPPWPQLALGIGIYTLGLVVTSLLGYWFWQRKRLWLGRLILGMGLACSIALGAWLATNIRWVVLGLLALFANIFSFWLYRDDPKHAFGVVSAVAYRDESHQDDSKHAFGVVSAVAFGMVFGVAGGMAFSVTVGVAFSVAVGVAFGVAVGVAVIVAFGVAFGVAFIVAFGVSLSVAVGMAGGVSLGVAVGVAVGVAGSVAALATLPLPWLALAAWLLGTALAAWRWRWVGVGLGAVFFALGFDTHGLAAAWVVLAVLLGYYRLLPFYFGQALLSGAAASTGSATAPLAELAEATAPLAEPVEITAPLAEPVEAKRRSLLPHWLTTPAATLRRLPPYSSELLWLPLPRHARLLDAAFAADPALGMEALERIRASSYPGFRRTIERALPAMVATECARVADLAALKLCASPTHPRLPILVPSLYREQAAEGEARRNLALDVAGEIALILPELQAIARALDAAQQQSSLMLQVRSLEKLLLRLDLLKSEINTLEEPTSRSRWHAVIERWRSLLAAEQQAVEARAQGEIVAAFQVGNPVGPERAALFKGREQESNEIMRLLLDRGRPTVVVHGPRRFGKSSFLRQLPRLLPIDVVYAFESAQNSAFRESDRGFCFGLARALYRDSQAAGLALAAPERRDFREEPFGALDDYLDQLEQQLGERSLLLALDEFELIGQALETGSLSLRVLDHLRYMIQHRSRLALIFGGLNTLAELGPNWTNYFINVQPLEMLYLTPQAARDLLENPDPQFNLRYEASVVEEILCLTRCQPYLLQAMGAAMVNLANRAKWQTFPLAQLSAASDEALQAGAIYFQELWNNYTGTNADEVRAGRAILRALAAGQPPPEPADASEHNHQQQALARLLRYHLVERSNGGYQIEIPLVAQWVRERAVD